MSCLLRTTAALLLLASSAAAQTGGDHYSVTLYGGHASVFRPRTGHTWATFTHTYPTADGGVAAEEHTISWLPATLNIRPFALRPETGANLTHEQTMAFMTSGRRPQVEAFGPYEITADRYQQLVTQKARLESGAVQYHGLGMFGRRGDVMHCIDAVTRTDPLWERKATPSVANGVLGTFQAVRAMDHSGFADTGPGFERATPIVSPWPSLRER